MCGNVECKTYSLARLPQHEECSSAIQVWTDRLYLLLHGQTYSGYHNLVKSQYLKQFAVFVFAESAAFQATERSMTRFHDTIFWVKLSEKILKNTTETSSNLSFADWVGLCQRTRAAFALSVGDSLSSRGFLGDRSLAKGKTIHDQRWSHFQPNIDGLLLERLGNTTII